MRPQKNETGDVPTLKTIDRKPPQKDCAESAINIDQILLKQCSQKNNTLKKCNSCKISSDNAGWPVISTQFDAKLVNTGFDGVNGKLVENQGLADLHWQVGLGDNTGWASVTSWDSAIVSKCVAWCPSPFGNSNWISYSKDAKHQNDAANIDVYFRYQFYLNSATDPLDFSLSMDFYADNSVHEIYVNHQPQSAYLGSPLPQESSDEYGYEGFLEGKQVHITLNHDWKSCENEIIVHVKSSPGYVGFLAQNAIKKCYQADFPSLTPIINITWGDSPCDCMESNDVEIMCITVCNPYSNVTFTNFSIGSIVIVDQNGNSVALLPDGNLSVELHPIGPYCFGNIPACSENGMSCVSREFIVYTRGAIAGKYKILVNCICFDVCNKYSLKDCFEIIICKD